MKRTKVFYKIRAAIDKLCHICNGAQKIHGLDCDFCHGSGREFRYIMLPGSSRSSKTTSLIQNFYTEAWNLQNKRFSVWRDTKKDCKDTVGNDMLKNVFPVMPYYSPQAIKHNKTDFDFTFPGGSVIELCGTDDEQRVHGYNQYAVWLNEPYKISKDVFDQLDMRTECFVCADLNPLEDHWSDDLSKDPRCIVIPSTFKDNQYCPPEQRAKILSYQPVKMCEIVENKILHEVEAKAYDILENPMGIDGRLLIELSRCKENERRNTASAYKWSVYGLGKKAERPNRILHWEEIPNDDYNKLDAIRYYGVDWGVVDPQGLLEAKYYDGALYFHELSYASENEIKESLTIQEIEQLNKVDEGLVRWYFNKLNIPKNAYLVCDTNRPLKIMALHEAGFDYAIAAPKPPGSIIDGINLLTNLKCYYTSSSKNIKYEQENYERQVDRYGIVLEEPCDKDNHLIDPCRYVALFLSMMGIIKQ